MSLSLEFYVLYSHMQAMAMPMRVRFTMLLMPIAGREFRLMEFTSTWTFRYAKLRQVIPFTNNANSSRNAIARLQAAESTSLILKDFLGISKNKGSRPVPTSRLSWPSEQSMRVHTRPWMPFGIKMILRTPRLSKWYTTLWIKHWLIILVCW